MHAENERGLPLVAGPIGELVANVQAEDPEIPALVASPRRQRAFRTSAFIRAGLVLGELLVDHDVAGDETRTWVDELLADPAHRERVVKEIRAVAREVAADPRLAEELKPDPEARERFRRFARRSLDR